MGDVPLLISPLHPARLGDDRVDQHQALHSLRVGQAVSGENIGSQPHTQPDILDDLEGVDHLLDLLGRLLHAGVLVVARQALGPVLLAGRVDVEYGEAGSQVLITNHRSDQIRSVSHWSRDVS